MEITPFNILQTGFKKMIPLIFCFLHLYRYEHKEEQRFQL